MRAEELFPDDVDAMNVRGARVRKGSIAAFAHNALLLELLDPDSEQYALARADLLRGLPELRLAGLFDVFSVRLSRAAQIVEQELAHGV
jgi:hypothetical protein